MKVKMLKFRHLQSDRHVEKKETIKWKILLQVLNVIMYILFLEA